MTVIKNYACLSLLYLCLFFGLILYDLDGKMMGDFWWIVCDVLLDYGHNIWK